MCQDGLPESFGLRYENWRRPGPTPGMTTIGCCGFLDSNGAGKQERLRSPADVRQENE